jgi:hypothetical protein
MFSTRHVRRPSFPFVRNGEYFDSHINIFPQSTPQLCTSASGFDTLHKILPSQEAAELQEILMDLSRYTLAIDDFVMGRPQALSLRTLANKRNFTQHSLMSRCPNTTIRTDQLSESLLSSCWLAAAIYSLISVFPMAHWNAPFAILSRRLKVHISTNAIQERWHEISSLMLWITTMGAIGAFGLTERLWYISVLERLTHRLNIQSWDDMKIELERFLWYDNISSSDGYTIWKEIKNSSPFSG